MKKKKTFAPPGILSVVHMETEGSVLAGSIVDDIEYIESTGQDVETLDFDSSDMFNHQWDE